MRLVLVEAERSLKDVAANNKNLCFSVNCISLFIDEKITSYLETVT